MGHVHALHCRKILLGAASHGRFGKDHRSIFLLFSPSLWHGSGFVVVVRKIPDMVVLLYSGNLHRNVFLGRKNSENQDYTPFFGKNEKNHFSFGNAVFVF